jgi:hypothetical protein
VLVKTDARPASLVSKSTRPSATSASAAASSAPVSAWNLHTALYYKADGVPWRLPRDPASLDNCYVGITFSHSTDHETLQTSGAQVFDQLGDGVIGRGAPAKISRHDRQLHLTSGDAQALLTDALSRYRSEHRHWPLASCSTRPRPIPATRSPASATPPTTPTSTCWKCSGCPPTTPSGSSAPPRTPPLRGTLLSVDDQRHILYTRGSVPFYGTYPGMYIPSPLPFRIVETESSPEYLADELLALTKVNWNQTQLDGRQPITIRTADRVGKSCDTSARTTARKAATPTTGRSLYGRQSADRPSSRAIDRSASFLARTSSARCSSSPVNGRLP